MPGLKAMNLSTWLRASCSGAVVRRRALSPRAALKKVQSG